MPRLCQVPTGFACIHQKLIFLNVSIDWLLPSWYIYHMMNITLVILARKNVQHQTKSMQYRQKNETLWCEIKTNMKRDLCTRWIRLRVITSDPPATFIQIYLYRVCWGYIAYSLAISVNIIHIATVIYYTVRAVNWKTFLNLVTAQILL